MLNASAIGLYGIVVGRPEMMPKIKRNAEYIKQITKLEKQQISFQNLLIVSTEEFKQLFS